MISDKIPRDKPVPEAKKEIVKEIIDNIGKYRTVLIASCKGLPGKQFHDIKKRLRGKAQMKVVKKSAMNRAIDKIEKGAIKNLKAQIGSDIVILFSDLNPFELSGILSENQSFRRVKAGDISPEDIEIEPGPTELLPGPAISELGSVGLKIAVKGGKLEIIKGAVVARKGDEINGNLANVLGKLNISPMKVGFIPLAAYDKEDDFVYVDIIIDKEGTLEKLKEFAGKALGLAVNISYPTKESITHLIAKASNEEKALAMLMKVESKEESSKESEAEDKKENSEEEKVDESKPEGNTEKNNVQKDVKEEDA